MRDKLKMIEWLIAALILLALITWVAPAQLPIVIYKVALVTLFAHLGYWISRRLEFRSGGSDYILICKAIVVAAVVLAGALAL